MKFKYLPLACFLAFLSPSGFAGNPPNLGGCAIYPPDHILNTPIDSLPVHPSSSAYIGRIGTTSALHADFGNLITQGLPYNLVDSRTQPMVKITIAYTTDSDPGPYPIPTTALREGGVDYHVLALDVATCKLYEMFGAVPQTDGTWSTKSGAIFDLKSYALRRYGAGSADAAGLAILPGLVRYEEILAGEINHAIRFTVPKTRREFVWPARHWAAYTDDLTYPPMGQRFRLKASFDTSRFSPTARVILEAMKKYGIIISDNGGAWFFQGTPDPRWPMATLTTELKTVTGANFEAVDVSSLMLDINSGQAYTATLGASLDSILSSAPTVVSGQSFTGTVKLQGPAPAGGIVVTLSSSTPAALSVPATVLVPQGAASATFPLTAGTVSATTAVTLTAFHNGITKTTSVSVVPPLQITSTSLSASSVAGGAPATLRVNLSAAAPSGGLSVALKSSNTALAQIAASGVIAAGATFGTFPITTYAVSTNTTVTLTATLSGLSKSSVLTLTPPTLDYIKTYPTSSTGGTVITLYAALSRKTSAQGLTIQLTSSRPDLIALPATMTIPANSTLGTITFTPNRVTAPVTVTLTATGQSNSRQTTFTINP